MAMSAADRLAALRAELLVDPAVLAPGPVKPRLPDGTFGPMPEPTAEHLAPIQAEYRTLISDALTAENARRTSVNDAALAAAQATGQPYVPLVMVTYGPWTDRVISNYLNEQIDGKIDCPVEEVREPLFASGEWGLIELIAAQVPALSDPTVPLNVLCRNVVATLSTARVIPSRNFRKLKAAADALLATELSPGNPIISQATHDAVVAAMTGKNTRAFVKHLTDAYLGVISPEDVSVALRG